MTTSIAHPGSADVRGFPRIAPAFALFFMSPFVAEFLLGDFSIDAIRLILVVGPMYGGGAVVVREVTRRLGRGWPTMMLLALAYGLLEEGIVIQTLFNPNYLGLHLLSQAFVPALGMSAWWTVFVLTLHTVWSISVPIAIVEGLFAERRTTPWLGNVGLGVSALLGAASGFLVFHVTKKMDSFSASPVQLLGTAAAIVLVVVLALRCRAASNDRPGAAPALWIVGMVTFVLGLTLMSVSHVLHDWVLAASNYVLVLIGAVFVIFYSRRSGWTPLHTVAAAGGAIVAYACHGFPQQPVVGSKGTIDLVGNTVFAVLAVTLLVLAIRKERKLAAAGA